MGDGDSHQRSDASSRQLAVGSEGDAKICDFRSGITGAKKERSLVPEYLPSLLNAFWRAAGCSIRKTMVPVSATDPAALVSAFARMLAVSAHPQPSVQMANPRVRLTASSSSSVSQFGTVGASRSISFDPPEAPRGCFVLC